MSAQPRSNLQQRVITAVVMAVVVVGALATGSETLWAVLVALMCIGAMWEGVRLSRATTPLARIAQWLCFCTLLAVLFWLIFFAPTPQPTALNGFLLVVTLFWLAVAPGQLARKAIGISTFPGLFTLPILIAGAWVSAVALQRLGVGYLLAVVVLTVVADVAGYFVGRKFGRVKLAPAISPGKTREGAIGGLVAAATWAVASTAYLGLATGPQQMVIAAVLGAGLGALAVTGDLWESQLKRQAGMKDSSQLLPGHGGVLDRIDAQLAVLPVATLLISLVKPLL